MDRTSSSFLATVGHVVAILTALLTAGGVWALSVGFQVAGSQPSREDFVTEAQGLVMVAALLLLLGPLCVRGLGGARWALAAYLLAGAAVGLGALAAYAGRTGAEPDTANPLSYAAEYLVILPTTYPLVLLALVAGWRLVRGASSRAPR